jgi:hypothetical protein
VLSEQVNLDGTCVIKGCVSREEEKRRNCEKKKNEKNHKLKYNVLITLMYIVIP